MKFKLSTTHILLLSFLALICVGTFLLSLPISSTTGEWTNFIDSLFTATTSVCVTGLVTVTTATHWSLFGQITILLLIQIGGLGVITFISSIAVFLHKKMDMSNRVLIQDALNIDTLSGLSGFLKRVIKGTLIVEGIGAILYMIVFIPDFGLKGIWYAIFNAVSAFCNAGMDVFSENSLCMYVTNPLVNFTTIMLIVCGGIGYVVWWDIIKLVQNRKSECIRFSNLSLHSKTAIISTLTLLFGGALLIFIFEYNNPQTIANYSLFDKMQLSLFQSVTTRTAGFMTLPQENFTNASSFLCLLLMFIGGSPVGTAGGIKTVTFVVFIATTISAIQNKEHTNILNRRIGKEFIKKSIAVMATSFTIMFISSLLLMSVSKFNVIDILYETVSATATVGLSRDITSSLNVVGKIIIICTMYLGRVGPLSLMIAFLTKKNQKNIVINPKEKIYIG